VTLKNANAEDEERVHKIDTTPPPEGEEDAYNAPTKVGEVSHEAWAALITQAEAQADAPPPSSLPKPSSLRPRDVGPESKVPSGPSGMPRLYEEEHDEPEEEAATTLHPNAQRAALGRPLDTTAPPPPSSSAAPAAPPASATRPTPAPASPLVSKPPLPPRPNVRQENASAKKTDEPPHPPPMPGATSTGPFAPLSSDRPVPSSPPAGPASAPPSSPPRPAPQAPATTSVAPSVPPAMSRPPAPAVPPPAPASGSIDGGSLPPSFALLDPLPNPASLSPSPPRKDHLLLIIGIAATLGFLTLAVGILLALGRI
jgi:hypothetical protein